ncbi:hypothetical protein H8L45_09355 [Klebsiella pneumoniae]|uniref:hypothetical protein n=1 Tax=Klebsiella pneumoniae TaxID=573 RepID=UPI000E2F3FC4|nr:hypothetical protein [Klebsiella pneumoniae]MBC4703702.1 hypothetical protein [Klebsiella pneumoniae]MBC4729775.1 hypothetical protein [Klebsiella pneumoniae]MBC4740847.1 hypothetical protein [Klebsiella pneumoniae]MCI8005318.1 hypothetical protein [Klebsiella pneumoniae]MDQ5102854.1 hypothetical protein [Klebsiella pneumoniae]
MGEVVSIESRKPNVCVQTPDGNVHVLPVSMLQKIADGEMSIDDVAERDQIIRAIIAEWLRLIHGNS